MTAISFGFAWSQCVPTCSNYVVSPVTYSLFSALGTTVSPSLFFPNADDGTLTPVPIGFSFDYYCTTYTDVIICTNGFIQLNYGTPPDFSSPVVHPPQTFPSSSTPNGIVALTMADLDPGVGGVIAYGTFGTAPNRMFVVTYSNVPIFGSSSNLNFGQIVLYETSNEIAIHTGTLYPPNSFLGASTQGIENTTGSVGTPVPGRNNNANWFSTANNTAYRFYPYTPAPPSAITGPTILCQADLDVYTATFISGATSYSWSLPAGWTGSSNTFTINTTAGSSGNLSVTATYSCGTSAPTTLSVTVVPSPTVSLQSVSPNVICSGNTVALTFTGNATTYTIEPGGLTGSSPITDMPMITTVYTLSGTNSSGCISMITATNTVLVKETPTVTVNSGTICEGQTFTMTPTGANTYVFSSTFAQVTPIAGTYTYSVTGTGTNGCVGAPALSNLTVSPLPGVSVSASRPSMCLKESVNLMAGGANTYSWSHNISSTGTSVAVSPTVATIFTVTGTSQVGCSKTATVLVNVKPCVGINEIDGPEAITLYPNPSTGEFIIESNVEATIVIYDILGKIVKEQQLTAGKNTVDMTEASNGKYFIRVSNSETQRTLVIIKN
jgi:hypothetical protein